MIVPADSDQLRDVQQVIQGIGAVPELVLLPEAGGYGKKSQFVEVRRFRREEGGWAAQAREPLS